jgi:hypothetical protein
MPEASRRRLGHYWVGVTIRGRAVTHYEYPDLQRRTWSASDGTRTRDLRRDRPAL